MKSKFTQVVRVKKQVLDKIEAKLVLARSNIVTCENNVLFATQTLSKFDMPRSGSASDLRQNLELLKIMRDELKGLKERLELAKKELIHLNHQHKNASLDYEKMKYLEQEDFKTEIKRVQREQSAALDEFAVMKFASRSNEAIKEVVDA
ncbi:flagellar FliJ family protein [Campylobacter sp. RM9344]|uniref:Flagellar FliJ family protein n=1 Tax=Campylobacter californiensis TaxID=1032243 RepID=A0AAW3ZXU0_9BACT|nr:MULTISPECIES: flagellar export protein FliJ [unclassified Campylobacter]MBE2984132.1 flagellar FliJ family protein [Campylobacter sp. RM6883]MBE2986244.1 flagellar FliJ family protein [Campylobacter sp. RM12919]MBE2988241.1 flagellar FliJ family protein [Campylobacter sp. RM12920]MBE2995794.1 flagellar FliJ family protein [Campylobacter sp. RM6913]MBE3030160.1 flagellar FliJ family protein [Campylobacter sp. RM9344]